MLHLKVAKELICMQMRTINRAYTWPFFSIVAKWHNLSVLHPVDAFRECCNIDRNILKDSYQLVYVPSGWKHYARDRKTLRGTFVSPGIMFFSLKDIFSWGFILWPSIHLYILMGSVSYCPYRFCIISWTIGCPPRHTYVFGLLRSTFRC